MSHSTTLYHPSLDFPFLPSGYISYVNKQPYGRYDVTKSSKEEVRLVAALCPNIFKQLVMLQYLILIGGDKRATLKEKELVNLAAEIFMIIPEKARENFFQAMCTEPKILQIFAKALKENVVIHSNIEAESKKRLSSEELENCKKIALVMCTKDVVCLSEEQLLREKAFDKVLSKRFQS